jgi:hypothetical protein
VRGPRLGTAGVAICGRVAPGVLLLLLLMLPVRVLDRWQGHRSSHGCWSVVAIAVFCVLKSLTGVVVAWVSWVFSVM